MPPTPGIRPPSTLQLIAFTVLGPFSMHLIIPAITPIQYHFGISHGTAAMLISATLWGIAGSTLFFGVFADRFGRRPMLMIGMALFVAGSVMGEFGDTATIVILGRVIQGIGGATGMVISRAVIRDLYDRDEGTSKLAYLTMAVMIAPILAPMFAGYIVNTYGWRVVFDAAAVTGLAIFIWMATTFPETLKTHIPIPNARAMFSAYANVIRQPVFVFYSLVGTFVMTSFFSMMSGAPYIAHHVWGLNSEELGYYLVFGGLGMVVSTFVTGRIATRVDHDRLMLVGLGIIATGISTVALLQLLGVPYALAFFAPMTITGFGAGFCLPTSTASALHIIPRMAGTASGLMTFMQFLVAGVAAQMIGYFDHSTPWSVIGFMVVGITLAVTSALVAISMSRRLAPAE